MLALSPRICHGPPAVDAPEPQLDHQDDPSPALLAARCAIESFETIASDGPMPEPMRTQMIECFRMSYDAAIERAVRKALEQFVLPALLDLSGNTPGVSDFPGAEVEPDPSALDVQPLNPEGVKLAGDLRLSEDGGFEFSR